MIFPSHTIKLYLRVDVFQLSTILSETSSLKLIGFTVYDIFKTTFWGFKTLHCTIDVIYPYSTMYMIYNP